MVDVDKCRRARQEWIRDEAGSGRRVAETALALVVIEAAGAVPQHEEVFHPVIVVIAGYAPDGHGVYRRVAKTRRHRHVGPGRPAVVPKETLPTG